MASFVRATLTLCASIAAYVAQGQDSPKRATAWVQVLPNGSCVINDQAIRCDQVARKLRSEHLPHTTGIIVFVDDAPYETVVATLDSLNRTGFKDVEVFPTFLGTNPSKSVKHWIKLVPEGLQNHVFWKVMISTESFRHWGENLVVVPESDFSIVDRLATSKIAQGTCAATVQDIPMDLRGSENRLWLFEHNDGMTQSCLFPRAAGSCEFLSTVMHLPDVHWAAEDLGAIGKVVAEIGCDAPGSTAH